MEDLKELYQPLSPDVNKLDPIVRHDPTVKKNGIVKFNESQKIKASGLGINNQPINVVKLEGPRIPIIRIDNKVILRSSIKYVHIDYDKFIPTCKVILSQQEKSEELMETASMTSNMTIVMTDSVDGAYKPISIDFYITKVEYQADQITYYGEYHLLSLRQQMTKQITFNPYPSPGCSAKYCQLGPNKYPTTYEFLHYVAVTECGLGFAATDKVKEIKDDKTRIIRSETYKEAIQKHVAFGGLDENSVFDCWVDLYRYLVVVNFSWVMNEKITPNDLGIHPVIGLGFTDDNIKEDIQHGMAHRLLTNYKRMPELGNYLVSSWKWRVNNKEVMEHGNINEYVIGSPTSGTGNDSLNSTNIKFNGNSVNDTVNNSCQFRNTVFSGYEYGDPEDHNTPVLKQKMIHDNYFRKYRAKTLEVKLAKPNFGLQRGTLISLAIFEYSELGKRQMWQNWYNISGDKTEMPNPSSVELEQMFSDSTLGFINLSVSGIYYIDGMSFEYDVKNEEHELIQKVYLIRRGIIPGYINSDSFAKSYNNT